VAIKSPKKQRLSFPKANINDIPLDEMIIVHRQFQDPQALAGNLGDGFLYATNPIYRQIRLAVLGCGFSFTTEDFCDYFTYPLMCLDEVIAAKKIPYRENFIWLEKLEKSAPAKFSLDDLKRGGLRFNYIFHESAHCIAHSVFFGEQKLATLPKNRDTLLRILLGEAFANTSECLASLFAEGELGSYFLDANCHYRSDEKEVAVLLRFVKALGMEAVAKVLLAAFLYSNFMYERLGIKEEKLIRAFAGIESRGNLKPLLRVGLSLCEQFRSDTTQLHLVKMGFVRELDALIDYDPLEKIAGNKKLHKGIDELAGILT
jgi:hypothetical protein